MPDVKQNQNELPDISVDPAAGFTLTLSIIETHIDAITAYVVWSFVALGDIQREFVAGPTPDLFRDSWSRWRARRGAAPAGEAVGKDGAVAPEKAAAA